MHQSQHSLPYDSYVAIKHYVNIAKDVKSKKQRDADYDADGVDKTAGPAVKLIWLMPQKICDLSDEARLTWDQDDADGCCEMQQPSNNEILCENFLFTFAESLDRRPSNEIEHLISEAKRRLKTSRDYFDSMMAICNSVPAFKKQESIFLIEFISKLSTQWADSVTGPEWGQLIVVFAFAAMICERHPWMYSKVLHMLIFFMSGYGEKLLEQRGGWEDFIDYCNQ